MRVFVDDQHVQGLPEGLTPGDAVAYCARQSEAGGRLVVGVMADGAPATEFRPGTIVSELRLSTAEPARLLADAYDAAAGMVRECRDLQAGAADALMEGRVEDSNRAMQGVMESWGRIHHAITQTEEFGRSAAPAAMAAAEGALDLRATMEGLAGSLRQLKISIGTEDWSAAADVLGVELIEQCEQWSSRLERCRDAAMSVLKPG